MQGTVTKEATTKEKPQKRLSKFMPSMGLSLDFYGFDDDIKGLEAYISDYFDDSIERDIVAYLSTFSHRIDKKKDYLKAFISRFLDDFTVSDNSEIIDFYESRLVALEAYISSFLERNVTWIDLANTGGQGYKLTSKVHVSNPHLINSGNYVHNFMENLVKSIGMTIIEGPFTNRVGDDPEYSGITSLVGIKESHASFHSWPEGDGDGGDGYFNFGLESCKFFDVAKALTHIKEYFGVTKFTKLHILDG